MKLGVGFYGKAACVGAALFSIEVGASCVSPSMPHNTMNCTLSNYSLASSSAMLFINGEHGHGRGYRYVIDLKDTQGNKINQEMVSLVLTAKARGKSIKLTIAQDNYHNGAVDPWNTSYGLATVTIVNVVE